MEPELRMNRQNKGLVTGSKFQHPTVLAACFPQMLPHTTVQFSRTERGPVCLGLPSSCGLCSRVAISSCGVLTNAVPWCPLVITSQATEAIVSPFSASHELLFLLCFCNLLHRGSESARGGWHTPLPVTGTAPGSVSSRQGVMDV